ncbi:MAG: hypothetical protein Q7T83_05610 [Thermodesulfovibrionales bacterium]|nr:hypothetical protein [Thermodesulfovibrionales bacterium]MDP3111924.1 hypothetical protein [Thermodesulfovibrionales bacterium]
MFATLVGTNTGSSKHRTIFDKLYNVAIEHGFIPPDTPIHVQPDGPLNGWSLEQKGHIDMQADFILAVTEPRVPGISPIYPVFLSISGPLFAVVVLDSAFVVSRADRRDVSELKDSIDVENSFTSFIRALPRP